MKMYQNYWDSICEIYFLTKHYLLMAEELSDGFDTFIQPLKEHRDAFDHIARVYGYKFLDEKPKDNEQYCIGNMKKALGHVYRAFFDTADFFSYICRKKIRELLINKKVSEILEVYPQYYEAKKFLCHVSEDIARIRENKDINDSEVVDEVEEYRVILDRLYGIYKEICILF